MYQREAIEPRHIVERRSMPSSGPQTEISQPLCEGAIGSAGVEGRGERTQWVTNVPGRPDKFLKR